MDPTQLAALLGVGGQDPNAVLDLGVSPDAPDLQAPETPPTSVPPGLQNPNTPIPPPTPGSPPPAPTMLPGASQSIGVKEQGFSPTKFGQVKKTQGGLDAQIAGDRQAVVDEYAPLMARQAGAEQNAEGAVDQDTQAQMAKITAMGEAKKKIADAYTQHENDSSAAYAQARTEAEGIKSQYRAALADYNGSKVNPAQLWENAGAGGRFGLMATAFVHDFLGAKGIKTSAMDTINQAIQRNIDTQLENIRHKRDVAQGFKELWDMQRAQSATDAEARERMFGFHLQGLTNGIDAEMSRYDSGLAQAKGAAAKAQLQQAMVQNDLAVQQHIDAAANARAQQRVQVYDAQLKASTAAAEIKSREAIAAGKIKPPADPLTGTIADNSVSGGGVLKWRFRPGVKDEQQAKVNEKVAATTTATRLLGEFQDMQRQAGEKNHLLNDSRFQSEYRRKANALRNAWLAAALLDSTGKASNQGEVDRMKVEVPDASYLMNGSAIGVVAQTMRTKLDETNTLIHQFADDIPKGDPAYGHQVGTQGLAPGEYTQAQIMEGDDHGEPKASKTDIAIQALTRPDSGKPASPGLEDKLVGAEKGGHEWSPQAEFEQFKKETTTPTTGGDKGGYFDAPVESGSEGKATPNVKAIKSAAFDAIATLRHEAEKGDKQAEDQLVKWATMGPESGDTPGTAPDGTDINSQDNQIKQAVALWELSKLHLTGGEFLKAPGE